jgi:hypothetical protein
VNILPAICVRIHEYLVKITYKIFRSGNRNRRQGEAGHLSLFCSSLISIQDPALVRRLKSEVSRTTGVIFGAV